MDDRMRTRELDEIDNPDVMHEKRDINVRAVLGFGAALVVAAVVIHVLVWLLLDVYGGLNASAYPRQFPLVQSGGQVRLPPSPRLQEKPREDLKALNRQEDRLLNGYTWINQATGAVRIPIADAMKQVLDQGFPVEEQQPEPPGWPTTSSSGRVTEPTVKR